jgi:hemerythrin
MALLNWTTSYSVGVDLLDKQHQKLFALLNELHDAMTMGEGKKLAPAILKKLVQYTCEHFAAEEKLMSVAAYPQFARHKVEHEKLKQEVGKMLQDVEQGRAVVSVKLMQFLKNWLHHHILGCDKGYMQSMSRLNAE